MIAAPRRRFWTSLYFQVLVAIALGVLTGWLFPEFGTSLKPLGDAFIKLVKMIITPVIFLTVTTGIAGMSDLKAFGRVGAKAMAYFLTFSTLALAVGLVVGNLVRPGDGVNADPATLDQGAVATYVDKAHDQSITGFVLDIIPDT
ncbi:MAG TPA: cation:dicarboxylase symporter family transporter, partial [Allosphingosinicella sp.]